MDYHIFLLMVPRRARFARESSAINESQNQIVNFLDFFPAINAPVSPTTAFPTLSYTSASEILPYKPLQGVPSRRVVDPATISWI